MTKKSATSSNIKVTTTSNTVRIVEPESDRRQRGQKSTTTVVVTPQVVQNQVNGFLDFIREHAVVGLAIGIVIGTQAKAIVDALNAGFIDQLFKLFFAGSTLNERVTTVTYNGRTADLGWGGVVYQIINFLFVMAIIYAIIKILKLDKWDKKREK